MNIAIKYPRKQLGIIKVDDKIDTLEMLQDLVEGYIERVKEFDDQGIDTWINEEGKLIPLKPNFLIYGGLDCILGNAVFTSSDEEGNTIGLTDEQIEFLKKRFKY